MIIKKIIGKAVPIDGDDIDTDQILPAKFMKEITFDNMGKYLFYDYRYDKEGKTKGHILDKPQHKEAVLFFAKKNFGCGSSREHAPQALKRYGVKAIVAESFAEIFAGNCKALGIPLVTVPKEVLDIITLISLEKPDTEFEIDLETQTISFHEKSFVIEIKKSHREDFLAGTWDVRSLLKANLDKIMAKDKELKALGELY